MLLKQFQQITVPENFENIYMQETSFLRTDNIKQKQLAHECFDLTSKYCEIEEPALLWYISYQISYSSE